MKEAVDVIMTVLSFCVGTIIFVPCIFLTTKIVSYMIDVIDDHLPF